MIKKIVRKFFSAILGGIASCSILTGYILVISNTQSQKVPDGYPLSPEWLIWILLTLVPAVFIFLAVAVWPKEKQSIFAPTFIKDTIHQP